MQRKPFFLFSYLFFLLILSTACTDDDLTPIVQPEASENNDTVEDEGSVEEEDSMEESTCTDASNFIFNEKDGLLLAEFEDAKFMGDWTLKTDGDSYSGDGYMVWEGAQSLSEPGIGTATYKLKIENPGTYRFLWYSAVKIGENGTEHNDTWLRFNDAADFYGQNDQATSTVYPRDTGKTPNPDGASKDGWFKIYRSGNNLDFKWQSSTFDNNAHNIFVEFDNSGTYLMEISARSSGHGIDKFVLFNSTVNETDALTSTAFSLITCN